MTVGTLHETVGCAASFTRFVPFSCCRPGQGPCCLPRRLWPAPACNLTGMARAGPPCSESARAYLVMSYLPDSGATAGPSRPCHYHHSAADRLPSSRPPLRHSESDWLSWLRPRGPNARLYLLPFGAATCCRVVTATYLFGPPGPVSGRDSLGRLSVEASPCRWSDAVPTTGPPPHAPLGSPRGWPAFGGPLARACFCALSLGRRDCRTDRALPRAADRGVPRPRADCPVTRIGRPRLGPVPTACLPERGGHRPRLIRAGWPPRGPPSCPVQALGGPAIILPAAHRPLWV